MESNSFCNQKVNKQNLFCLTASLIECHDVLFLVLVTFNKVELELRNVGKVKSLINIGRAEWSPIRSVIRKLINKIYFV